VLADAGLSNAGIIARLRDLIAQHGPGFCRHYPFAELSPYAQVCRPCFLHATSVQAGLCLFVDGVFACPTIMHAC
jgi:hypothetical protein